jgi:hypothetical protein
MTSGPIFISYARRDGAAFATRLQESLPSYGFTTWRDTRDLDPTHDFTVELEKAIEAATHVVACVTADVRRGDSFVRREIGYAQAVRKPIFVARFADVVPPISVVNLTRFDFFADWDAAFQRLVQFVRTPPGDPSLQADGFADSLRPYLEALYRQIVRYLDKTVFTTALSGATAAVIPLTAEDAADAVVPIALDALPRAFFEMAGIDDHPEGHTAVYRTLTEAFEQHGRRLLLLGAPGSGKTTALMAFARDAVSRRLGDPSLPLPIVAPIAAWDPTQHPPIDQWLGGLIPSLAGRIPDLLARGGALLLLDGLEELGDRLKGAEEADGEARNDPRVLFLQQLPENNQIVLTCRVAEYHAIGVQARLQGAVTLRPLDDEQVRVYLARVPALLAALEQYANLRDALRVPLLLSLFASAFAGHGDELQATEGLSTGDVRDAIFAQFIRSRYEHERRKPNASVPFTLDELYWHLGSMVARVEPYLPGGGWWDVPTLLTVAHMRERFGDEQGPALAELLTRLNLLVPVDDERMRFLHPLLRDHLAYQQAMKLAASTNRQVRTGAMVILRDLKDPRSVPVFTAALNAESRPVRWNATRGLAAIRDPFVIPVLISRLDDNAQPSIFDAYDQTPPARTMAADALVAFGAAAVEPLIAELQSESAQRRGAAAEILGLIGDPRAIPALETLAARSSDDERATIGWWPDGLQTIAARALSRVAERK